MKKEFPFIVTTDEKIAKAQYDFAIKIAKKSVKKQPVKRNKSTIP